MTRMAGWVGKHIVCIRSGRILFNIFGIYSAYFRCFNNMILGHIMFLQQWRIRPIRLFYSVSEDDRKKTQLTIPK